MLRFNFGDVVIQGLEMPGGVAEIETQVRGRLHGKDLDSSLIENLRPQRGQVRVVAVVLRQIFSKGPQLRTLAQEAPHEALERRFLLQGSHAKIVRTCIKDRTTQLNCST